MRFSIQGSTLDLVFDADHTMNHGFQTKHKGPSISQVVGPKIK